MRLSLLLSGIGLATAFHFAQVAAIEDRPAAVGATAGLQPGFDPAQPLAERVTATPPDVLRMFADAGFAEAKAHTLTISEQHQLAAALDALPPLHQKVLREQMAGMSFLDGMPNTALTSPAIPDDPRRLFHITFRAGIFREDASEWATTKERTYFDASGSPLSVSIDAGKFDSILYVLLHEATHIVDGSLRITPDPLAQALPSGEVPPTDFTRGVWSQLGLPSPRYRDPLMQGLSFKKGGKVIPIAQAETLYASLQRTPFASLYSTNGWPDDLAEYLAIYHWTQVLKQPYRITVRDESKVVLQYEPMNSDLVRGRFDQMAVFYRTPERLSLPK